MSSEISVIGSMTNAVPTTLAAGPPMRFESRSAAQPTATTEKSSEVDRGQVAKRSSFAIAQAGQDVRTQQAVSLRDESERLNQVQEKLTSMKEDVSVIVKQYPPFAADSPERVKLLNQITGLKKQIEALMVTGEQNVATASKALQDVGDLSVLDKEPSDLISDEDLEQLLGTLDSGEAKVTAAQKKLWADVQACAGASCEEQTAEAKRASSDLASIGLPISQSKDTLASFL